MLLSGNLARFRKEHKKMKHKKKTTRSIYVNQVKITFTKKPITAWGGIMSLNPDIAVEGKIELQKKRKANKNAPFR